MALTRINSDVADTGSISVAMMADTTAGGVNLLKANLASPAFTGNPTAPTAAQFDSSASIANTAFVHSALGNSGGTLGYTATATLPASAAGKWVFPATNPGIVLTLPDAGTVTPGSVIYFSGNGVGCTVQRAGTDSLVLGGTSANTYVMQAHETAYFVSVGTNNWYLLGGTGQNQYATDFAASFTANGYQKLPSGMIIQWGNNTITAPVTTFNFPIAFPNGALSIAVTDLSAAGSLYTKGVDAITTTQFTVRTALASGGDSFFWIAVGH